MYCPRLSHFVRFNTNGSVGRCGHMVSAPEFGSLEEMESSMWLRNAKLSFTKGMWPQECVRCKQTEQINGTSIRLNAIEFDKLQTVTDYLTVGGVLDNVCNSGCLTCNANHSTKIGSLVSKTYPIVDNSDQFWALPMERVVHLDINGGEPSASKNYSRILKNLPANVATVRINTNCAIVIPELADLQARGVKITVTVSLDGIGPVHDRVRWPVRWDRFYANLQYYQSLGLHSLNTWTTVSALNIGDFNNILAFVKQHGLDHSYALLHQPDVLNVRYSNSMTEPYRDVIPGEVAVDRNNQVELDAFVSAEYQLRGMS